ncbi:MAG: hypothetical protein HYT64_01225 [Candidatus Yanofskybacteria bacterium]|nr:hypothetical protein [Candidatus Yanofskybacteria bacterium]
MNNTSIKFSTKKIIALTAFGVLMFSGAAHAQTSDLPDPGTLPGSPFYFVKGFFEGIGTFFTFGNSAKAERYLALAEKRLAEAEALAEQGDERAQATIARYEEQYAAAKERAERAENIDLEARVTDATTKHLAVLDGVLERVPEQARASVLAAKERSVAGQLEALRGIAERDPETAVDIFARAAEGRLNAANARAGRGGDDENEAEEVEKALEEYEKYAEFGQEISTLAEGIRTGETAVEDLVKRATSHHLQVLEDVRQKLPPQAQQEFQRALESARKVQQLRPAIPAQQLRRPEESELRPEASEQRQTPGGQPTLPPQSQQRGNDVEENEIEVESETGGPPQGTSAPVTPGRPY